VPNEVPHPEAAPTIALIGATPTAELIAARALRANLNVIIDDISDARLQATSIHLRDIVGAQPRCAPGPQEQPASPQSVFSSLDSPVPDATLPTLHLTQSIESAIRQSDFLIDTLPDDLEVKLELFTLFDKFAKPTAIFITTGSIPIDDLAAITFCPDRCLAVRLTDTSSSTAAFNLIPAKQTSARTLDTCTNLFLHSFAFREK
jgi:3-hydroxyacyl-CoA dehydrogenase